MVVIRFDDFQPNLTDDTVEEIQSRIAFGETRFRDRKALAVNSDLKPSNVMIDGKGRARIADFGPAIAASEADQRTVLQARPDILRRNYSTALRPPCRVSVRARPGSV